MNDLLKIERIHKFFRISVFLKGVHAVVELVSATLLLVFSPALSYVPQLIASLMQDELFEDPHVAVANFLVHAAQQVSVSAGFFAAFYLLIHGVVKMFL